MSETLLDKSISNYNVAVMIRNQMGSDEAYLNWLSFTAGSRTESEISVRDVRN